jgi:hypothetical protein
MDPARLTLKSQETMHDAQTKALRFGHAGVDGDHLLLALIEQAEGIVPRLLAQAGGDPDRLRSALEAELSMRPRVSGPGVTPGQVNVTQRLARLLDMADQEAGRLRDEYGPDQGLFPAGADQNARQPAGELGDAGDRLRGAREVRPGPGGGRGSRPPRLRHRAGRRDTAGDPDPVAENQEQPGAHRRSRCRQRPRLSRAWPSGSLVARCPRTGAR